MLVLTVCSSRFNKEQLKHLMVAVGMDTAWLNSHVELTMRPQRSLEETLDVD